MTAARRAAAASVARGAAAASASRRPVASSVALLLPLIDEAYDRRAWHGPNLRGSLRGLSAADAAWRPRPGRHNIRELVVHAAYWKYAVRRRLTGARRGSFRLEGSNWIERPGSEASWKEDLDLLGDEHRLLREVISALPESRFAGRASAGEHSAARLIRGIAAHDLYHAGQIRLVRALAKPRRPGAGDAS
ncbi:MAG: DinB family protein [Acidobacteria bacterium]|nr:DinB family protein [Acidobacteriota bacterium]MCA1610349.1 DinB family protein [Acidobacteriota bacterium]